MLHEKTDLKVFVIVIQKEGSFCWYDTDSSEFGSADNTDYILEKSVSYQKKDGRDKDLKVCFLVTRVIREACPRRTPGYKVERSITDVS